MIPQVYYPFRRLSKHFNETLPATVYTINVPTNDIESILVQVHTQNAYYTLDGSTPSATNGFVLYAGNDPLLISMNDTIAIKFLGVSGAILQWEFGA